MCLRTLVVILMNIGLGIVLSQEYLYSSVTIRPPGRLVPMVKSPITNQRSRIPAYLRNSSASSKLPSTLLQKQASSEAMKEASAPVLSMPLSNKPVDTIRGQIKVDKSHKEVPAFRLFFEGKETKSNCEGFFSFPVDAGQLDEFSLIISKRISHTFDKTNTIKHGSIIPDKNYRLFTFSRSSKNNNIWQHTEDTERAKKVNFVIPPTSIILLVDPKYVKELQPYSLSVPEKIVALPVIVLKGDGKYNKIERAGVKSLLYSLDHTPFHESVIEAENQAIKDPKLYVSLPK